MGYKDKEWYHPTANKSVANTFNSRTDGTLTCLNWGENGKPVGSVICEFHWQNPKHMCCNLFDGGKDQENSFCICHWINLDQIPSYVQNSFHFAQSSQMFINRLITAVEIVVALLPPTINLGKFPLTLSPTPNFIIVIARFHFRWSPTQGHHFLHEQLFPIQVDGGESYGLLNPLPPSVSQNTLWLCDYRIG